MTAREACDLARIAYEQYGPKDEDHQLPLVPYEFGALDVWDDETCELDVAA